ncbi:unnamed protein product [Scytosiphon promiscuus]
MWKPDKVVAEHKRRAKAVWIALLLTTLAYTIWQVMDVVEQYKNPSTTLNISNDLYDFPSVKVCFTDGYGCHYEDVESYNCVTTAESDVYFDGDWLGMSHTFPEYPNCIEFDLSTLEVTAETFPDFKPSAYISMTWTASTTPSEDTSYSEMIGVVLGDFDTYALTYVPYARTEFPTDDMPAERSIVTIQKTHRTHLFGEDKDTFTISTIATAATDPYNITVATIDQEEIIVGSLFLGVEQALYSLVEISDDKPLSVGSLLGNIGGFWELLLVAWGVFFISTMRQSEPEFKARNLRKAIKQGKAAVSKRLGRSRAAATPQNADPADENRPDWEAPYRAASAVTSNARKSASTDGAEGGYEPHAGQKSAQQSLSASCWRRPVENANPSRVGASPSPV